MSVSLTASDRSRVHGNELYKAYLMSTNLPKKKRYLEKALESYAEAWRTALSIEEKCSASKNYGTAAWKMTVVLKEISADRHTAAIESKFKEAVEFMSKALAFGQRIKDGLWLNNLTVSYAECVKSAIELHQGRPQSDRIIALENIVNVMQDDFHKGNCYFEIASLTFLAAVVALAAKDYRSALRRLHDCYRPVQECLRLCCKDEATVKEIAIIQRDVEFHLASAESLQAVDQGDCLLKIAVKEMEGINMDLLYEVIDWYKQAVLLTREVEVELEGVALSRLGYVYDKVLRMKSRAKDCFMRSVQLAMSLHPRTFHSESWFQTCTEALQRYQKESLVEDESKKQEERKKYMKELEKELSDVSQANCGTDSRTFLKHIYKAYPPKNPSHVQNPGHNMKKALLTAIQHYHPDKQDREAYGEKWAVLCEEIVKVLTPRYENYKHDPSETTSSTGTVPPTETTSSTEEEEEMTATSTEEEEEMTVTSTEEEEEMTATSTEEEEEMTATSTEEEEEVTAPPPKKRKRIQM